MHPGGPLWARRDDGVWSIPKGEVEDGEEPRTVAAREFNEELGQPPPEGDWLALGEITQKGGKRVSAWAVAGDLDVSTVSSNHFELEWPPRSGRVASYPEVDRAEWFGLSVARRKLIGAQVELLDRLAALEKGVTPD